MRPTYLNESAKVGLAEKDVQAKAVHLIPPLDPLTVAKHLVAHVWREVRRGDQAALCCRIRIQQVEAQRVVGVNPGLLGLAILAVCLVIMPGALGGRRTVQISHGWRMPAVTEAVALQTPRKFKLALQTCTAAEEVPAHVRCCFRRLATTSAVATGSHIAIVKLSRKSGT